MITQLERKALDHAVAELYRGIREYRDLYKDPNGAHREVLLKAEEHITDAISWMEAALAEGQEDE